MYIDQEMDYAYEISHSIPKQTLDRRKSVVGVEAGERFRTCPLRSFGEHNLEYQIIHTLSYHLQHPGLRL